MSGIVIECIGAFPAGGTLQKYIGAGRTERGC